MDKEKKTENQEEQKDTQITEDIDDLEAFFDEAANPDEQKQEEDDEQDEQSSKEEDGQEAEDEQSSEDGQEEGQDEEDIEDGEIPTDPDLLRKRYKTLQAMYKKKLEQEKPKSKSDEGKEEPKQQQEPKQDEPKQDEPKQEEPEVDVSWVKSTLENTDKFKEFSEDFPEIAGVLEAAISSIMAQYTKSLGIAFQTLMEQIDQKYQPIASSVKEISEKEKKNEIKQYHPDFDTIISSQEFKDWLEAQPPLLKKAYTQVLEEGTVQDLAELLNDFKLKTGFTQQQNKKPAKKKKPKTAPETKTKPTTMREPIDMDDFEQAFYEAVREGG